MSAIYTFNIFQKEKYPNNENFVLLAEKTDAR